MLIKPAADLLGAVKALKISDEIYTQRYLKDYTSLNIGGPAEIFIRPRDSKDLNKIVTFARENGVFLFILGEGSKVLIPDEGVKGITLKLNSPFFKRITFRDDYVITGCGVKVDELLKEMVEKEVSGWEFFAGMPASIAGMLIMNAGIRESSQSKRYLQIGDFTEEVTVMDYKGNILNLRSDDLKFDYRRSNLSDSIVLEAKLSKAETRYREDIKKRIAGFINYRKETQELAVPSAGCVFKNPSIITKSSGELIELSGLKGKRIGDVAVSNKHANFIINIGKGSADDFLKLMDLIQKKVKSDHGILLEPEINIVKS